MPQHDSHTQTPPPADLIGHQVIRQCVVDHYRLMLADDALAPYFQPIADLRGHIDHVADFWWGILGGTGRSGRPHAMETAHRPLAIPRPHLLRWLDLLAEALQPLPTELATVWLERARGIGEHMIRRGIVREEKPENGQGTP